MNLHAKASLSNHNFRGSSPPFIVSKVQTNAHSLHSLQVALRQASNGHIPEPTVVLTFCVVDMAALFFQMISFFSKTCKQRLGVKLAAEEVLIRIVLAFVTFFTA